MKCGITFWAKKGFLTSVDSHVSLQVLGLFTGSPHSTHVKVILLVWISPCCLTCPCNGKLWMQKSKSHLMRTQNLKVLPLKPGVGQYIAMHATLTARDFFLAVYPSSPFTCIFPKPLPSFSCVSCC